MTHSQFDEGGLKDDTEIRWTVMRDGVRHRLYWGDGGNHSEVQEETEQGDWIQSDSQIITKERFPMRLFSQGQIAEMAGDNQLPLLQLIDEAAVVAGLDSTLDDARNAYYTTRVKIRDIEGRLERLSTLSLGLQDVERKLGVFEGTGHAAVLTGYRHRENQQSEVDRHFEVAESFASNIDNTIESLQPEDLPDELFDTESLEDRSALEAFASLRTAITTAAETLREAVLRFREDTGVSREELGKSVWQQAVDSAKADYSDLVDELQKDGINDLDDFGPLMRERERVTTEMNAVELERKERDGLLQKGKEQLQDVLKARRQVSSARETFLSDQLAQNDFVRIILRPYGDGPRVIERSLREALDILDDRFQDDILHLEEGRPPRGIAFELLVDLPENASERTKEFEQRIEKLKSRFELACTGNGDFGGHFKNYLERRFGLDPGFLDRLMTWFPEDALDVQYSRRGDGNDFRPIAQASAGQRAAAMLAFLLAHGDEPLVLDQPEDDLDNQLIYDLVVQQIRENKLRRQIIVVTHNPNIVVNGDAEMLHILEFGIGQCFVAESGSLQEKSMRNKICQVMEGGREAFDRRYKRLGAELT